MHRSQLRCMLLLHAVAAMQQCSSMQQRIMIAAQSGVIEVHPAAAAGGALRWLHSSAQEHRRHLFHTLNMPPPRDPASRFTAVAFCLLLQKHN
jgi:SLT domain-containing protein